MKKILAVLGIWSWGLSAQQSVDLFPLNQVEVTSGVFKEAALTDFEYIKDLEADRLLAPFLREAGLEPKAESYTNWENTGLDGHTAGHYLSALSMYYASTGDLEAKELLDYALTELQKAQQANGNGYVGGIPGSKQLWDEIKAGKINASSFGLNNKWVPLYNIHKTFNGLKDAWLHAEIPIAKDMLIDLTDWFMGITENLSQEQIQNMLRSEHGGLNEVFAEVYAITGDKKYLKLAKDFSQLALLEPLAADEDILTGMHANTQIPKFIGFERINQLEADKEYHDAASNFYDNVTEKRSLSIGGNSVREHFNPVDDFSSVMSSEQGPESCNTYNMLKLSKLLFEDTAEENYIDFYERALYNHILSTQNPEGGFVYFTPMRPGHYRVYSQPETSFWCCVGSGMENHTKYNELIYAKAEDKLYVNLFIPSEVKWEEKQASLKQETRFPEADFTELIWQSRKKTKGTLMLRYPEWVAAGALKVYVNGKLQELEAKPGSYIALERKWKNGDRIRMEMPMHLSLEQIPDESGYVSVKYGPLVLAAVTGDEDQKGMFADDSRGGHIANGPFLPLTESPTFVSKAGESMLDQIKPIAGKTLQFTASQLLYPDAYKDLVLQPFYNIHEKRYTIYFKTETPESLAEMQRKLEEQQKAEAYLRSITLDYVAPGEQQPESDHGFDSKDSNSGVHQNRHWRDATGWFSYDLRNKDALAKTLRITYYGKDAGRKFDILVNGQVIASPQFDGTQGNSFFEVDYDLPDDLVAKSEILNVRFEAAPNSRTSGIYGVRLLNADF
ncbi:beta-L-arabinofuranosidase domain-containing protein [Leeuwenhoekiella parthenopeia]|uniref:Glycoside hydrolase family 127 protein n=1 Tax=Leeuwenhoekiella parthenopeia TaxID=2890320 RepID=A0ABS8GMD1_9FLAO|nr:beta-L-arabinofuranosidase domain-containing protein [Leeuwenhoekiella parthenopeia]MCC4211139.1 glycoside hydrolase family 127 protein [Leeuwenhoekiella parthenopeia]